MFDLEKLQLFQEIAGTDIWVRVVSVSGSAKGHTTYIKIYDIKTVPYIDSCFFDDDDLAEHFWDVYDDIPNEVIEMTYSILPYWINEYLIFNEETSELYDVDYDKVVNSVDYKRIGVIDMFSPTQPIEFITTDEIFDIFDQYPIVHDEDDI